MSEDPSQQGGLDRSLVIPLKNEARRLDALLEGIEPWCREPRREVILVDDGSDDDTAARIGAWLAARPELSGRLISLPQGEGKGGAVRAGLLEAKGACAAFTDADLPYGLEGVEAVFAALEGGAPLATGARDLGDDSQAPPVRRLASLVFRTWVRVVADVGPVRDTQCGVKGFRREVIPSLFLPLSCRGFAFDIEVLARANRRGLACARVPVTLRSHEDSTVSLRTAVPALLLGSLRARRAAGPRRGSRRLGRLDLLLPLLAALVAANAVFGDMEAWGGRDWDFFQTDMASARKSLLEEGELPLWQPYRAGGLDAWADPQSAWASPLGILSITLGISWGPRLFVALCAFMTALGGSALGAGLGLGRVGRNVIGGLLAFSTPLGLYAAGGVPTFSLGLAVLPWLVAALIDGSRLALLAAGALLALDLYGGDINHFLLHSLFLAVAIVAWALIRRQPRQLLALLVIFGAAVAFAAPKIVPAYLHSKVATRSREQLRRGAMSAMLYGHAFLNRDAVRFVEAPLHEFVVMDRQGTLTRGIPVEAARPGSAVMWIFVGHYVGPLALFLAGLGLLIVAWPRGSPGWVRGWVGALLVSTLLFAWLSCGKNAWPDAWRGLTSLPIYSALRAPERLSVYPFFLIAILAGVGSDWLIRRLKSRGSRSLGAIVGALLLGVLLLDLIPPTSRAYRQAFIEYHPYRPELLPQDVGFLTARVARPPRSSYYGPPVTSFVGPGIAVSNNVGAVFNQVCTIPYQDPRYQGEAFLLEGEARYRPVVTARRIEVPLGGAGPGTLVINQNHAQGWRVVAPAGAVAVRSSDGRLAVRIPAGTQHVHLRFTSPGLWAGLLLALVGIPSMWLLSSTLPLAGAGGRDAS